MDRRGEIPPDPLQQRLGVVLHDVELHSPRLVGGAACGSVSITVKVFKADLDVDSNNDGQIAADDDVIESNAPGKILACNNDFDNGDGNNPDCNVVTGPVSSEDDLVRANLAIVGGPPNQGKWSLSCSPSNVRVWSQPTKDVNVPLNTWKDISEMPSTVYLEGVGVSAQAGGTQLTLSYDPRGGTLPMGSDAVRLTVAKIEITDVWLPNEFVVTFDEDEHRQAWYTGVSEAVENRFAMGYRIHPNVVLPCDGSKLTLRYQGTQWVGPPFDISEVYLEVCSQENLPGATNWDPPPPTLVDIDFAADSEDPRLAGIRPSNKGGHYRLVVASWNSIVRLHSDPCEVQALPLVQGFRLEPNDPNGFCPYTTQQQCPPCSIYENPETYWGVSFVYELSANLQGHDEVGYLPDMLHGTSSGLAITVAGKTLNVLADSKKSGLRRAKWEGYDSMIDEPAGEPYFWGPHDPSRMDRTNICDYPQTWGPQTFWGVVPGHVVPETPPGEPYRADVTATMAIDPNVFPGFQQVYRRMGVPVAVRYDLENTSR